MKKTYRIVSLVVVLLFAVLLLTGCKKKEEEKGIIGSWNSTTTSYIYTFNKDGTGYYDSFGKVTNFTYTAEKGILSILYDGNKSSFKTEYYVDNDTLSIKDSSGKDAIYKRK